MLVKCMPHSKMEPIISKRWGKYTLYTQSRGNGGWNSDKSPEYSNVLATEKTQHNFEGTR